MILILDPLIQEPVVSEPNDNSPSPSETTDTAAPSSSGPTLVSMLLLIAALSLGGIMMLHYAAKNNPAPEGAEASEKPEAGFNFEKIANLFKKEVRPADTNTTAVAAAEEEKGGFKLFSGDGSVRWPKLKLTGFGVGAGGGEDFAIINGQYIHPGQLIDGKAKLVEVREHDVVVEYKGETKALMVGAN